MFCFILRVTHQFHSKNEGTPLKQNLQVDHLNLASVFPISAEMKTDTGPTSYSQSWTPVWMFVVVRMCNDNVFFQLQ